MIFPYKTHQIPIFFVQHIGVQPVRDIIRAWRCLENHPMDHAFLWFCNHASRWNKWDNKYKNTLW